MRLGLHTNTRSFEDKMQKAMAAYLERNGITYKEEVSIPEVHRRADFLVIKNHGLINIEAKCNDYSTLIKQLDDHAKYCSYCFAYITNIGLTPQWFKRVLRKRNYGLIVYDYHNDICTEVLEAHMNKGVDKQLERKYTHKTRNTYIEELKAS